MVVVNTNENSIRRLAAIVSADGPTILYWTVSRIVATFNPQSAEAKLFNLASLKPHETVLVLVHIPANNPTYLSPNGLYRATREGDQIHFVSVIRGSGTFERLTMLRAFARNKTVQFELVQALRVTGWNPEDKTEVNLGGYLATSREDAFKQARKAHPDASNLVLDAAIVGAEQ